MTIGRICQREVDFADANETVQAVANRMLQRGVGSLVVTDPERRPVGIVTDRDLTLRALASEQDMREATVSQVMTVTPKTVTEETPIEDVLAIMRSGTFRRMPVVDERGRLVGLVSVDDILRLIAEELADIGVLIERETPVAVLRDKLG